MFHPAARPFSATIEKIFLDYFKSQRIPNAADGRSTAARTTARSSRAGIPAGGLFTGAEGSRRREQAAICGGTAGEQFDPCYHEGCDNFFNNSNRALDQNSDAAAHALITLAQMKIPDRPAVPRRRRRAQRDRRARRLRRCPTLASRSARRIYAAMPTVLITGCSTGIGRATAARLVRR